MCAVSAVIDYGRKTWPIDKTDEWDWKQKIPGILPTVPTTISPKMPTQEEIDEFYKLLNAAREFDKKTKQPDCEREELKQWLVEFEKRIAEFKEKL